MTDRMLSNPDGSPSGHPASGRLAVTMDTSAGVARPPGVAAPHRAPTTRHAPISATSAVGHPGARMRPGAVAAGLPGRAPVPARGPQVPRDLALGAAELRGVLRVVEDCERAASLPAFREAALDGMARHLGYRHSAFFLGSSPQSTFQDARPTGRGLALRMAGPFLERYRSLEVFNDPESLRLMWERGLVTLDEIGVPDRPEVRLRLERFLRAHGIHAKLLIRLAGSGGVGAVVSLLDPRPGAFGPRDRAVGAVLARHLGNLLRFYIRVNPGPAVTAKLSARERDVVRLVAEGQSNRQVAEALCISIDTVKHHLTHALVATGCSNRTQLALAWQREMGSMPAPGLPRP